MTANAAASSSVYPTEDEDGSPVSGVERESESEEGKF